VFLVGGVILWGQREYSSAGPLEEQICLRVERGASMRGVSQQLERENAVTNSAIFRMGADYSDKSRQLKAGSWLIPAGTSMSDITDIITRGGASTCGTEVVYRIGVTRSLIEVRELDPTTNRYVEKAEFNPAEDDAPVEFAQVRAQSDTRYRIAIAEGVTSWQIVEGLKSVDVLDGEVAEVPPEGSLAPDSYDVATGDSRAEVISQMRDKQDAILASAWENRAEGLPLESAYEALILASIIEKETGVPTERGEVASVFTNRLNQGMKLQTDPTVIYGVTEGVGVLGRGLRQSELRASTPWNTYVINGLPPTPIASPGRASIEAAVNPPESDYIFFVAKSLNPRDGHLFAVTLEEHNANVALYRELERQRDADQ